MLLFSFIFLFLFVVVLLCVGFGQAFLASRQKGQIRTMLRRAESHAGKSRPDLLNPEFEHDSLSKTLDNFAAVRRLGEIIEQSGLAWTTAKFLFFTFVTGLAGLIGGLVIPPLSYSFFSPLIATPVLACLPFLVMMRKRSKRLAQFEEQFPEALNFLSRSMRAGHAFTIGLEMLVGDAPEPLSTFFRQMLNELHLGSTLEVALAKLERGVPLIDVRFFVSAILLQQGTGGNLGEILDSMANIIRERFRLKGQVKAASAHGRVTGLILAIMPMIVAALLFCVAPDYLLVLVRDPDGKKMVIAAAAAQLVGFFCIRKITNIKV